MVEVGSRHGAPAIGRVLEIKREVGGDVRLAVAVEVRDVDLVGAEVADDVLGPGISARVAAVATGVFIPDGLVVVAEDQVDCAVAVDIKGISRFVSAGAGVEGVLDPRIGGVARGWELIPEDAPAPEIVLMARHHVLLAVAQDVGEDVDNRNRAGMLIDRYVGKRDRADGLDGDKGKQLSLLEFFRRHTVC